MNQTITAQADIQNGTRHMFLYMSGWSQVSDSRYDHDRHYRYQLFEPPPFVTIIISKSIKN
jgi:hypothetical protein